MNCPELSWLDSQDSAKRNSPVFPFKVMGTKPCSPIYLMPHFMQHKEKEHKHLLPTFEGSLSSRKLGLWDFEAPLTQHHSNCSLFQTNGVSHRDCTGDQWKPRAEEDVCILELGFFMSAEALHFTEILLKKYHILFRQEDIPFRVKLTSKWF